MIEVLERLAAANIQILPVTDIHTHFVLERDGFAALVERRDTAFGGVGAAGLLTEHGLSVLVWRGPQAFFVARGHEQPATPEQIAALRQFASDLQAAIAPQGPS